MNLEKLKKMLENGTISQEEFDEMVSKLGLKDTTNDDSNKDDDNKGDSGNDQNNNAKPSITQEDIDKMVQSAVDRATNKLGNKNKELSDKLKKIQEENNQLKREKLSADEVKQLEMKEWEERLQAKENEIKRAENERYATNSVAKLDLADSESIPDIVKFVMADEQTDIDLNVQSFSKLVNKIVQAEVDKKFKASGREPNKSGGGNNSNNPYLPNSFNLTKQMELERSNPELAAKYQQAAGIK